MVREFASQKPLILKTSLKQIEISHVELIKPTYLFKIKLSEKKSLNKDVVLKTCDKFHFFMND